MGEADAKTQISGRTVGVFVLTVEIVLATVIAAWALVDIWRLAYPADAGTACALIYPGPPGCWPHARFTPAFISAVVISLGYSTVVFLLMTVAQRRAVGAILALGGLAVLGVLATQFVTWGGVPG
ncbi:hypothetical protein GCM10010413_37660 [Promicromonospora sukumoe]|uniref:Vitamin K epoxide reductase family protein n=1 Tax=Promicromonospora sukumoe TaxID=88382 RepID=A0A7W3PDN2_9MICO|nr:hypothetical protein [Promicromonospora sukumoe]MBA8807704.1 hypothetical protein [Promicromonospora sukumoe]